MEILTINGVNFGATKGTVSLNGGYVYPSAAITSWTDEKIVVKLHGDARQGGELCLCDLGIESAECLSLQRTVIQSNPLRCETHRRGFVNNDL